MRLGILTQCHFPSLTWKECTSHNRLHHPAIKPCQGAAFLALPGQLWRERSPQTRTPSTEGPPLLPRPALQHPALERDPWPLALWPAGETCVPGTPAEPHTARAAAAPSLQDLGRRQRVLHYYYCYYGRAPAEGGCGVKVTAWCWRRVCFSFFLCLRTS